MLKLSYIIPVFNSSATITNTLNSIFAIPITETDYEIIIVDDCSTDDTLSVLQTIALKHSNVRIFHQDTNRRQGAARNRGIDVAKGEYIAFCDADDMVVATGVLNALNAVKVSKAEICYFEFEYESDDGLWHHFEMPQGTHNTIMSSGMYLNEYYTCYFNAPWRCLYRTDFLRSTNIRFVEGVRWEDCDWTVKVYTKSQNIQFINGIGYRYKWNTSASSKQKNSSAMAEQIMAGCRLFIFSHEIKESHPKLSLTLYNEARYRYIMYNIRLRNLSKYSSKYLYTVYYLVPSSNWDLLKTLRFPLWEASVIRHHYITLFILFIIHPFATIGRKIVEFLRKY